MNHCVTRAGLWAGFALVLLAPCAAQAADCTELLKFSLPGATPGQAVTIQKAEDVPAGTIAVSQGGPPLQVPMAAHCQVEGIIGAHTGRDGKSYGIRFALALPEQWNGRLLYQGGGGLNGAVLPPVGGTAAGDIPALARGFAVVSSDSGHQGAVFDASFMSDQQAALDFLYQDIGKVMTVARPLVLARYARPAAHSYFVGCSTGGREAMIAAQRYPDQFDGIVVGSPAQRTNYSNLALRWVSASLNVAAPKDAQGHSQTQQALSSADRKLVVSALLQACDALDGVRDGMIFDTRHCGFDPKVLQCKAGKNASCLTAVQVHAIERAFGGPRGSSGRQVYPGFMYDTGIGFEGAGIPGLLSGGFTPEGPKQTSVEIDVDAESAVAHDGREMAGDTNAWTNLSTFNGHGGKLIFFHGDSDPWFSALDTVGYYERLASDNGPATVQDWSRLFLVPGMGHCGGGEATLDHFDMLTAIVDWVEQGTAPERVIATGTAFPGRSRPLYWAWRGYGHSEKAENFSCKD